MRHHRQTGSTKPNRDCDSPPRRPPPIQPRLLCRNSNHRRTGSPKLNPFSTASTATSFRRRDSPPRPCCATTKPVLLRVALLPNRFDQTELRQASNAVILHLAPAMPPPNRFTQAKLRPPALISLHPSGSVISWVNFEFLPQAPSRLLNQKELRRRNADNHQSTFCRATYSRGWHLFH
ncbi:uncharacterized protein LOC127241904 [Andrographis paniculata]|uniref:uncharacterized protein LOC127241904 n=1 Tax=Andrographis paniculata TaxID=175694 RepID=UPI0021E6E422|nr:uncharacterized protein LOC127241904 [Andrographis paniculata]